MKSLLDLTTSDLAEFPVWEYVTGPDDSVYVGSVKRYPVTDLQNRIVGTKVVLNNGDIFWAILGNIDLRNRRSTDQFLTMSIERHCVWFDLARYHDVDYSRRGPHQLAQFLALPVTSVFPIEYDLSGYVSADPGLLKGIIPLEPRERLPQDQLIQLALEVSDV